MRAARRHKVRAVDADVLGLVRQFGNDVVDGCERLAVLVPQQTSALWVSDEDRIGSGSPADLLVRHMFTW